MPDFKTSRNRDALGECTAEWRKDTPAPIDAVLAFRKKLGSRAGRYTTYLSTAITAGGYIRDPSLPISEVSKQNSEAALLYADFLADHGVIDLEHTIDAVALGHIPGWEQSNYLRFWLPILTRPTMTAANIRRINETMDNFEVNHDMGLFNDSKAPHKLRRPLYQAYGDAYLSAVDGMQSHPIHQTVQLVDGALSLGGNVEALVSQASDIAVSTPAYGGTELEFIDGVDNILLQRHLAQLAGLGAQFVRATQQPGLSLQPLENQA